MEFSKLNSERILQSHLECLAAAAFCLTWCWVYSTARTRGRSSNENVHLCLRDLFLQCLSSQMRSQLWDAQSSEVKGAFRRRDWRSSGAWEVAPGARQSSLRRGMALSRQRDSKGLRALADCLLLDFQSSTDSIQSVQPITGVYHH